jgi:endoglucanase
MDFYLDILTKHEFNALRIPISEQLVLYEPTAIPAKNNVKGDVKILKSRMKCMDILELLFQKSQDRGIAILLDMHVLKIRQAHPLWYLRGNRQYTEDTLFKSWEILLHRFGNYSNLLGIEIINEPHDNATFGPGDVNTSVDLMVQRFMQTYPRTPLIFIDGIWWGKDFRNISTECLDPSRTVFAPHFYGPTLAPLPSYSHEYLAWYYNRLIGNILGKQPIVITEWGFNPKTDAVWVENFVEIMRSMNLTNSFFWSLNPMGKDIQGLLVNWTHIDPIRFEKIVQFCPTPTKFSFTRS